MFTKHLPPIVLVACLLIATCPSFADAQTALAATDVYPRALNGAEVAPQPIKTIADAIQKAQPEGARVRVPLNDEQLSALLRRLRIQGYRLSKGDLQSAVDVLSTYMRENPETYMAKIAKGLGGRLGFHGNAAEFAEARLQNLVLTKSLDSPYNDLTELRVRPRNSQLKIYKNPLKGLRSALDDVTPLTGKMGRGARARVIVPQDAIDAGLKSGILRQHGEFYAPTDSRPVTVMSSKAFGNAQESVDYTARGQRVLANLARGNTEVAEDVAVGLASAADAEVTESAVVVTKSKLGAFRALLKSPGIGAGVATIAIDSGIAGFQYERGDKNKTWLARQIQNAVADGIGVGMSVQVLYLLVPSPSGLVVAGVAIASYVVAQKIVKYARSQLDCKYVTVDDLKGLASPAFLRGLPPSLEDIAKGKNATNHLSLATLASDGD